MTTSKPPPDNRSSRLSPLARLAARIAVHGSSAGGGCDARRDEDAVRPRTVCASASAMRGRSRRSCVPWSPSNAVAALGRWEIRRDDGELAPSRELGRCRGHSTKDDVQPCCRGASRPRPAPERGGELHPRDAAVKSLMLSKMSSFARRRTHTATCAAPRPSRGSKVHCVSPHLIGRRSARWTEVQE